MLSAPRRHPRWRLSSAPLLLLAFMQALTTAPPAAAQGSPAAEIAVVTQRIFHRPSDPLGMSLSVTNTGTEALERFGVRVDVFDRIVSRSELHATFDGVEEIPIEGYPLAFEEPLAPGETRVVTLDERLDQAMPFFPEVEGVYPVTVSVVDAQSVGLDSTTSHLLLYPRKVDDPLNVSLVVPIGGLPARSPEGVFYPTLTDEWPLEHALSDGWLKGMVEALEGGVEDELRLGVAPSPRLVEEIADLADGYRKSSGEDVSEVSADAPTAQTAKDTLERIEGLLNQPGVQPLLSPYSGPDLPTLLSRMGLEQVTAQLSTATVTLGDALPGVSFDPAWLFAPGARWDQESLDQIGQALGGSTLNTFISPESFQDPIDDTIAGCPPGPPGPEGAPAGSFTCAVGIPSDTVDISALVRDRDLHTRLGELAVGEDAGLELQRLFAELAFIHLEAPGLPRRVVHLSLPVDWRPGPTLIRRLISGLATAPWVSSRTPAEALDIATHEDRQPHPRAPQLPEDPGDAYFQTIAEAARRLEAYSEIGPPEDRIQRLRRNLLVAQSRLWWLAPSTPEAGAEYATATSGEIDSEFEKIAIDGINTTLTSNRSPLELTVSNEADYPITVDVDFESSDEDELRIDQTDDDELRGLTIEPGQGETISVEAIADSSGFFRVDANVLTPDTGAVIAHRTIDVRSTNFNRIALGITFGALVVIVVFYALRLIKRRRGGGTQAPVAAG